MVDEPRELDLDDLDDPASDELDIEAELKDVGRKAFRIVYPEDLE